MKERSKKVWGIILIVVSCLAGIGGLTERILQRQDGLIAAPLMGSSRFLTVLLEFMMFVGGIILLIRFKKPVSQEVSSEDEDYFVLSGTNQPPTKRNALCTVALVFAILSIIFYMLPIYVVFPIVSLILGIIGLKRALSENEKGEGFAKWAITAGIAGILTVAVALGVSAFEAKNAVIPRAYEDAADTAADSAAGKSAEKKMYSKGIVTENGYESEYLDLRFTVPSGWVMRSESELTESFGAAAAETVEMSALNLSDDSNLHLLVEKLPVKNASLEQYKEAIKTNWNGMGMEFQEDRGPVDFCGETYDVMVFNISNTAGTVQTDIYVRIQDDRLVYIMAQYLDGNTESINAAMDAFTEY